MSAKATEKSVRPLVAGNWKMNGTKAQIKEARALVKILSGKSRYRCETMICPPATLLSRLAQMRTTLKAGRKLALGGQDCHAAVSGAHTGDVSAEMLKDAGASAVILGHSERRSDHEETDKQVKAKVEAAHRAGLTAIMCVGESLKQRKSGDTLKVVGKQLRSSLPDGCTPDNLVVAYEPVWAIGSGLTPSVAQVAEVHLALRKALVRRFGDAGAQMRILYGGSVKPANIDQLMGMSDIDGVLVGGASLDPEGFGRIANYIKS